MEKTLEKYASLVETYVEKNFKECFRDPKGQLKYPFLVPGSYYRFELWDWDSWLTDLALATVEGAGDITDFERGCILNFLDHADEEDRIPINILPEKNSIFDLVPGKEVNIHKPCLAQHALFVAEKTGDVEWLRPKFETLEKFNKWYFDHCRHEATGLFFWLNDFAIGVDNEPCTFYRPNRSTGSIFLNCLMVKELDAMAALSEKLGLASAADYKKKAEDLRTAVRTHCWDERDGFYYSVDLNLNPVDPNEWLHSGAPRHWDCLIMRIDVWSGFLALWAGIATPEQAKRIVENKVRDDRTFRAPYGIRSLSKLEKMYVVKPSGNPSCWLGPIWGNANYMTFEGLLRYGYVDDAREIAEKTVTLFGKDIEECGEMHEYYDPDTGVGVFNQGFQSWNLLSYNLAKWLRRNDK